MLVRRKFLKRYISKTFEIFRNMNLRMEISRKNILVLQASKFELSTLFSLLNVFPQYLFISFSVLYYK